MATTYGQRGGVGFTRGKRAETLRSPSTGQIKRVFKGQRFLVVGQLDEDCPCFVDAYESRARAERASEFFRTQGFLVHYVEEAEVVA